MTPQQRAQLEAKAERAMRRGELSLAWSLYRQLAAAFPADPAIAARLAQLADAVDPSELAGAVATHADPSPTPQSPLDQAELLAARGDYERAIELYRAALESRPSPLLEERLDELRRLASVRAPRPSAPSRQAVLNELLNRVTSRPRKE